MPGKTLLVRRYFFRRAFGNDLAAAFAAFRAKIDDPVGGLDHIQVMLDHDHRIAMVAQPMQHFQQQIDVLEMQAGSGLVQNIERAAGVTLGKFQRQLYPLGFAARKAWSRIGQA